MGLEKIFLVDFNPERDIDRYQCCDDGAARSRLISLAGARTTSKYMLNF
jgi:hypothetical protein